MWEYPTRLSTAGNPSRNTRQTADAAYNDTFTDVQFTLLLSKNI